MDIKPGVKLRTVVVTGDVNDLTIKRGTYVFPFPWTKDILRVESGVTVGHLTIEQPLTVWRWQGWCRFGKMVMSMPSGNYHAEQT